MMKLLLRLLSIFLLAGLVIGFFSPLFFPIPQIFVTPDSYLSDILHFHYPIKALLFESLQQNQIPLWTDLVGTGFPLIGEGQIQAFSIINLILFKFLPFITAFNMQYVVLFSGFTIGMYLVAREFGWSIVTAVFCAVIYAFSGLHIAIIPHINCLQALSYVPFIFWILLRLQKNPASKLWLLLPLLLSQQILQGHYQYVFMSYIFFGIYGFLMRWKWNHIIPVIFLSLGLAAIQLFPSFEYFLKSEGRSDLAYTSLGSFRIQHLIQFLFPYGLGDIRNGTYPGATYGVGFWETFAYIGQIPIILALCSIIFIRKNTWVRRCWILIAILFLFVFGKNSPIYFIFSIPPFQWFRVESRFLAFITILLVLLAGFLFDRLEKKFTSRHILIIALCIISILDVLSFASSYNPMLPIKEVEKTPHIYTSIPHDSRMIAIPSTNASWYDIMYTDGWKQTSSYLALLNNGQPNYSIIHNLPNLLIYAGFLPQKQIQLMGAALDVSAPIQNEKTATLSALSVNTLRLTNTETILSPWNLMNKELTLVRDMIMKNTDIDPIYLYHISNAKPRYYLTSTYKQIHFIEDYRKEAGKEHALSEYDAFLTTKRTLTPTPNNGNITVLSDIPTKKIFTVKTDHDTFFVASIYLYPGWEASLDGQPTPIEPANMSGMAVFIPKGHHTLTLEFQPKSIMLGAIISAITLIFYLWVIIRSLFRTAS